MRVGLARGACARARAGYGVPALSAGIERARAREWLGTRAEDAAGCWFDGQDQLRNLVEGAKSDCVNAYARGIDSYAAHPERV